MSDSTETMAHERRTITVNIFGTDYPIEADADPEVIREVARYVDRKMREITRDVSIKSATKVAIQAALNVTAELFEERQTRTALISHVDERAIRLTESLNRGLVIG